MKTLLVLIAFAAFVQAEEKALLTPKEIADGWIMLFDGESDFGWTKQGLAQVQNGEFFIGGGGSISYASLPIGVINDGKIDIEIKTFCPSSTVQPLMGNTAIFKQNFRPKNLEPLFDGKTLNGWKLYKGDPKRELTKYEVTKDGEIHLSGGPGDLQSEKEYADFLLQFECRTNGMALNSGVFFRCLPGQYQQGYECQIQNGIKDGDRTKPTDFGTGAIYRRVAARKVVSNDKEWFSVTVLAVGPNLRTWVNGYPVVNWTDDRRPADNARNGLYVKAGPISLQGHDPTTDILFRNIRIVEVKK